MAMTKNQLRKALMDEGIEFSQDMNKDDLQALYDEAIGETGDETMVDEDLDDDLEIKESVSVVSDIPKQASLVECMRQLVGKKPFEKEEE